MKYLSLENQKDGVLLVTRVLLVTLFIVFGWQKLNGFSGTVGYMTAVGAPAPALSTVIAIIVELGMGLLILLGFFTRPLALLVAAYSIVSALIGHQYWNMTGMDQFWGMINFYKNVSIAGGLLLLAYTGPGRYSIDRK